MFDNLLNIIFDISCSHYYPDDAVFINNTYEITCVKCGNKDRTFPMHTYIPHNDSQEKMMREWKKPRIKYYSDGTKIR